MQQKQPCSSRHTDLVVVTSLLNELVHYFVRLLVTLLLQVGDECVQVAGAIICLHYRLMRLDDPGDTCRCRATPSEDH